MATATAEPSALRAQTPAPFRVRRRVRETADTWTLELEPVAGRAPSIAPGQFMMVYAFGVGEIPISVSGRPFVAQTVVLTVRAVGAVSRAICAAGEGSVVGLRGPYGNAWPVDDAAPGDVVVVGGGIGLAPLRPVVLHVLAHRARFGRLDVLYGARTPSDLLYPGELGRWRGAAAVEMTVDAADPGWRGKVGVAAMLLDGARFRPASTTAFVCGPEIMLRFTAGALVERGVPPERIFVSLERHMDCGVGLCGHCQLGPTLICRDGPVYTYAEARPWLEVREL